MKSTIGLALLLFSTSALEVTTHEDVGKNFVCNGGFEEPKLTTSSWYDDFTQIPCWTTSAEKFEVIKNVEKLSGQAMDLNTVRNGVEQGDHFYQEDIKLDECGNYVFKMDYIANPDANPNQTPFQVLWNEEVIADITPEDHEKHEINVQIKGFIGVNKLELFDKSTIPLRGSYVDNIAIYKSQ